MKLLKIVDIVTREMKLPKGYAPMLTCGELETLLIDHTREDVKLKFVIKIYEVQETNGGKERNE